MPSPAQILVVDDDASVRFYLEETLSRDGHAVTAVESGQAALDRLAAGMFDLALIDVNLKDMDGIAVLAHLRRYAPDTVAIILTGHGSLESAVEALKQGAHDYLFKPCKTVELRESIRTGLLKRQQIVQQRDLYAALERHMGRQAETLVRKQVPETTGGPAAKATEASHGRFLQRGRLVVDFMRHIVTLDDHLLELSPTEFDLLAYLMSASPRVVPPQELVREVQGYSCEPWEAGETLRYHVYRLRQKIKQATGRADVIQTMRGVGYAIKDFTTGHFE